MPRSMIVTDKNVREVAEALGEYFQNILGEDWANVMHDAVAALDALDAEGADLFGTED